MTRMLVVASPSSLSPLSTAVPLPTDGLPEQADCPKHGRVVIDYGDDGHIADDGPDTGTEVRHRCIYGDAVYCVDAGCGPEPVQLDPRYPCGPLVPDGPFPFTVAVWQRYDPCPTCNDDGVIATDEVGRDVWCLDCEGRPEGAVVATVEVTGPGHRGSPSCALHPCGRGDVDGWHTPTGTVTRLDVPIPMERPYSDPMHVVLAAGGGWPAPWWFDDLGPWCACHREVPA